MRRRKHWFITLCVAVCSQWFMSCGLIDLDVSEDAQEAYELFLEHDSVYVMEGDVFTLSPRFSPDSVSNREVFWRSGADSVVTIVDNTLIAQSEGETYVSAVSVQDRHTDSCYVYVMPRWEVNVHDYPYEMVVYAKVSVHGQPIDPTHMLIGAFAEGTCRGIGVLKESNGISYMEFRILGNMQYRGELGEEEVTFFAYDRKNLMRYEFPAYLIYDGETHGSLSNLFTLNIP